MRSFEDCPSCPAAAVDAVACCASGPTAAAVEAAGAGPVLGGCTLLVSSLLLLLLLGARKCGRKSGLPLHKDTYNGQKGEHGVK